MYDKHIKCEQVLKWKNETCKAQKKPRNIRKAHNIHSAFEQ